MKETIDFETTTGFIAGTLVHTKDGLKPIENICVGDWVLSYPCDQTPSGHMREESEYVYRQVKKISSNDDQPISHVTAFDLASGLKETVGVTPNYPLYEKDNGCMPACRLHFGSALENWVFGNLLVTKTKNDVERARVYNIEVDEFHTYYVGELGIWVHHCNCNE